MWRLVIENLARYTAETAALILVGLAMGWLLRNRDARVQLLHWQILLAVCVILPFAGRWHTPLVDLGSGTVDVVQHSRIVAAPASRFDVDGWKCAAAIAAMGVLFMLIRLAAGAFRLARHRRHSAILQEEACGVEVRISAEVSGPVSYGMFRPVILLPADFETWPETSRRCVLAHELAHVNRHDWLFGLLEEFIRALLWFHPGVWLVINRIHLSREQVVDRETLGLTGDREAYLDTLLSVAGLKERLDFVPAPLFVRQRHLAMRVAHLVEEVKPMNRIRMMFSLAAGALTLAGAGLTLTTLFPFEAPAQEVQRERATEPNVDERLRVSGGGRILHRVPPKYPPEAKLKHIEGTVSMEVSIDANGLVTEARVLSGPDQLRRAAIQAILQWQFEASGSPTSGTAELTFRLPKESPQMVGVLKGIDLSALPESTRPKVAARIPLKEGDSVPEGALRDIQSSIAEVDLRAKLKLTEDMVLVAGYPDANAIRVGGNVQSTKLVKQPRPVYPPEAKAARIQGTVRLTARIDKAGKVADLYLESGHPILVPSAMEAVKLWEYETTLLNGSPVEVITQIDVNYTLSK